MERQITLFEQGTRLKAWKSPSCRFTSQHSQVQPLLKEDSIHSMVFSKVFRNPRGTYDIQIHTCLFSLPLIHAIRDDVTDRTTATHDIRDATDARWDRESERSELNSFRWGILPPSSLCPTLLRWECQQSRHDNVEIGDKLAKLILARARMWKESSKLGIVNWKLNHFHRGLWVMNVWI